MAALESRISVHQDVLFRDLGGEAVLLNLKTGRYYGLDEVGTRMWLLLTQHGRVEAAYRVLLDEYDVTTAAACGQIYQREPKDSTILLLSSYHTATIMC